MQRWDRIADLFAELTAVPPGERGLLLDQACGGDQDLRHELISLLHSHEIAFGPLDAAPAFPPHDLNADPVESSAVLTQVGPYRLLRPIGEGGMGSVWLAERSDGVLKRAVALKRPHVSWIGALAERMAMERDILAGLEHANIARLYDAGVSSEGQPYLALEYIEGVPITEYCDGQRLGVRRRLELFLQVLDAVHYAHSHLVIHRDLKPSNILVSADGRGHLLDFGIAKLLYQDVANEPRTQWGGGAGTPDYASPEHITGRSVSTASDVYSLGVLLAELLAGSRPYHLKRNSRGALEEAILEAVPLTPSRTVRPEAAPMRGVSSAALTRALRGDLDNIILKALQKRPEDRYATVDLLAHDISSHMRGEPILAQRGTPWYYASKFLRRHKLVVGSAVTVLVALVIGLAAAITQAHRAAEQSRRAETEARTSQAVEGFLKDIFLASSRAQPDPVKARLTTARELLQIGVRKIDGALDNAPAAKLRTLKTLADLQQQLALDDEAVALNRKQVALAKQIYGANHARVAEALVDLSSSLMATQANDEREGVLKEALAILDRNKDFDSQLRGNLLGEFAQWAYAFDAEKSLRYAEDSVRILRRYPPSRDLTEALIMEGVVSSQNGQRARADVELTESLSVAVATEGALSPKLPRIYAYRADARYYLGDWEHAEQDLREGYRVARALGGDEDMQTIQMQQRLGLLLLRTSRVKEAVQHAEGARAAVLKRAPADDPWFVPMTLETTGLVLGEVGDLEAGLRDLGEAARGWRKYHADSSDIISGFERYAHLLIAAGRLDEADALLLEVEAVRAKLQDYATNPNGNVIVRTDWLIAKGRAQEANALMKGFAVTVASPKAVSVSRLQRSIQQARIDMALGHPAEVIGGLRALRESIGGTPLRSYLETYEAEADYLEGKARALTGESDAALPLLQQAHALYGEIYDGRLSLPLANAKVALADCLMTLGRIDDARALATQAAAILATHREVGEQYRKPLRALRARLARP